MREIKFRAKQINDNNWIYGYGVVIGDGFCAIPCCIRGDTRDWKLITVTCDINTLGQYTGLKDKNGKEIYEGDIVLTPFIDPIFGDMVGEDLCVKRQVKFNDGSFVVNEGDGFIYVECFTRNSHIEICGNIHDNHELLTK